MKTETLHAHLVSRTVQDLQYELKLQHTSNHSLNPVRGSIGALHGTVAQQHNYSKTTVIIHAFISTAQALIAACHSCESSRRGSRGRRRCTAGSPTTWADAA